MRQPGNGAGEGDDPCADLVEILEGNIMYRKWGYKLCPQQKACKLGLSADSENHCQLPCSGAFFLWHSCKAWVWSKPRPGWKWLPSLAAQHVPSQSTRRLRQLCQHRSHSEKMVRWMFGLKIEVLSWSTRMLHGFVSFVIFYIILQKPFFPCRVGWNWWREMERSIGEALSMWSLTVSRNGQQPCLVVGLYEYIIANKTNSIEAMRLSELQLPAKSEWNVLTSFSLDLWLGKHFSVVKSLLQTNPWHITTWQCAVCGRSKRQRKIWQKFENMTWLSNSWNNRIWLGTKQSMEVVWCALGHLCITTFRLNELPKFSPQDPQAISRESLRLCVIHQSEEFCFVSFVTLGFAGLEVQPMKSNIFAVWFVPWSGLGLEHILKNMEDGICCPWHLSSSERNYSLSPALQLWHRWW